MITPEELKAWREIEEKATEGPWSYRNFGVVSEEFSIAEAECYEDAQFIAHSRNTYGRLLDEVERLKKLQDTICTCHRDADLKGLLIRGQCKHGRWRNKCD